MHLIDTNILLRYPSVLNSFDDVKISIRCIEELDGLKKSFNDEVAYQARRATHKILQHMNDIRFEMNVDRELSVDEDLICIAHRDGDTIITNDLNIQIKCQARKVQCQGYDKIDTGYTGVTYCYLPFDDNKQNQEVEQWLKDGKTNLPLHENEFLIVKDKNRPITVDGEDDYEYFCTFFQENGRLKILDNHSFYCSYVGQVTPRNIEQNCLVSLLNDEDVSILLASGTFGTGKSYLLTTYALSQLEKGKIDKIVYVPNNSGSEDSRELGILPGELIDKELVYMGPIIDLIGEDVARRFIEEGKIEIVPISIMRGRSFNNSIIIVNEAQNLTINHIKLLVGRCGRSTRIFFDGDIKQSDSSVFRNKSGLKLLLHLKDSPVFSKIFGTVKLITIERSLTAQASSFLDNLLI